jgi:hypothetical protein
MAQKLEAHCSSAFGQERTVRSAFKQRDDKADDGNFKKFWGERLPMSARITEFRSGGA